MKKRFSFSVFYNYLLSYVGIAVFFCALLGIFLFNFFVEGYSTSLLENEQKKASVVVTDIESQMNAMAQIGYSVSYEMAYSFSELQKSNYTEFRMLKELSRYSNDNMLTRQYFLLYYGHPRVYSAFSTTAYDYDLFMQKVLLQEPAASGTLYQMLNTVERNSILPLGDTGDLLFCVPVQINSAKVNAVLAFHITQEQLNNRIQMVSGGMENYELFFNNMMIANRGGSGSGMVPLQSFSGHFSLNAQVNPQQYMSRLLSYRRAVMVVLLICAGILIVGIAAAHFHSKPIRKIKQRLHEGQEDSADFRTNELNDISLRLNDIMVRNEEQRIQFSTQMHLLRSQALHLLLHGEYNDAVKEMLERMNIVVENGYTGVIVLRFEETPDDETLQQWMDRIEELSMEKLRFYCASDSRMGDINIIIYLPSMQEVTQADAVELLRELLDAEEMDVRIGDGWIYPDPRKLAASYAEACDDLLNRNNGDFETTTADHQRYFERIVGAVRLGETSEAKRLFNEFELQNQELLSSMMMQRYVLTELLNMLVNTAREMRISIPHHQLSVVLTSQNCQTACDGLREVLDFIGAHTSATETTDDKLIHKVVDYVRNHYTENDLSLDRLASEFHVSAGYLSRLFRSSLGIKYKDYVLRLKMEYAKECLTKGISVTNTSKECGYANISHFIKAFRLFVGVTPSAYQKGELPAAPPVVEGDEEFFDEEE